MALPVLVDSESAMKKMAAVQPMLRQSSRSRDDRTTSRIRAGDLRYLAAPHCYGRLESWSSAVNNVSKIMQKHVQQIEND
jgi:hypothetical protein